jgi:hypothetical protein
MAGICLFTRAPHLRVEITQLDKGQPNPNERRFDSDARRSICMAFGYSQDTFRLELIERGLKSDKYNVLASPTEGATGSFVGTLEVRKQEWKK